MPASYDSTESPSVFDAPAIAYSDPEDIPSQYGEVQEHYGEVQEVAQSEPQKAWMADPAAYETHGQAEAQYDSPAYDALAYQDVQAREQERKQHDADEPVLAIHEQNEIDYAPVASEPDESAYDANAVQEVHADLEEEEAEPVIAQPEVVEETELKVAISGKASREEKANVNITTIFSQASRAKQEAQASEAESSSSTSRHGSSVGASPGTMEAMHNLTSFVRRKEESTSQLKMCIIQRDETLEHISQRYSLPVSKIVEVNRLASEQVVAGQILYIPQ